MRRAVPLLATLPKAVHSQHPLGMEAVGQSYGYILYRTVVRNAAQNKTLVVHDVRDYAQVYVDSTLLERWTAACNKTACQLTFLPAERSIFS